MKYILAGVLLLAFSSARAERPPLNIVVIDVCSARADHFGAFGGPAGLTPGLDAFAKDAAAFENFWAQSTWCLPNYATLLTGHRPEVHGLVADAPFRRLSEWEGTLAGRLRRAGYRTGAFSSGAHDLKTWDLDRGFDVYVDHFSTDEAKAGRFADSIPDIERFIDQSGGRPFFVYATVDDLHTPYQTDAPYDGGPDTATLSVDFFRAYNGIPPPPGSPLSERLEAFRRDPGALAAVEKRYRASLRSVDRSVSKFLAGLKKRGLWDKTIIVVTADHGESLGEHGLLGHTEGLYETTLRVPTLIHHPRFPRAAGSRISALAERIDLTPTLLESAAAPFADLELQGKSLRPLLANPSAPWRRVAYASSKRQLPAEDWAIDERAVRDERWKLIWSGASRRWLLFDLANDPGELKDFSAERPDVVSRLALDLMAETERARTHATGRPSGRVQPAVSGD
jgi:arylsulfatase A-like enzyme